jgi:hypothetical protein
MFAPQDMDHVSDLRVKNYRRWIRKSIQMLLRSVPQDEIISIDIQLSL